jgi:transcriptional regulator with XRE-family HTH domain
VPIHRGRIAMMERGMTQAELATRASRILGERISRSLVSMFLIGERTPDIRQARALSKALSGAVSSKDWTDYEVPSDALRTRKRKTQARQLS